MDAGVDADHTSITSFVKKTRKLGAEPASLGTGEMGRCLSPLSVKLFDSIGLYLKKQHKHSFQEKAIHIKIYTFPRFSVLKSIPLSFFHGK